MTPRHHIISITVIILEEKDCTKFLKKIFKKNYEKNLCKKIENFSGVRYMLETKS